MKQNSAKKNDRKAPVIEQVGKGPNSAKSTNQQTDSPKPDDTTVRYDGGSEDATNHYRVGDKVSVYSKSQQKWFEDAVVLEVKEDQEKVRVGYDRDDKTGVATKKWITYARLSFTEARNALGTMILKIAKYVDDDRFIPLQISVARDDIEAYFDAMEAEGWKAKFKALEKTFRDSYPQHWRETGYANWYDFVTNAGIEAADKGITLWMFISAMMEKLSECHCTEDLPNEAWNIPDDECIHLGERRLMDADTPANDDTALAIAVPNENRSLADAVLPLAGLLLAGFFGYKLYRWWTKPRPVQETTPGDLV